MRRDQGLPCAECNQFQTALQQTHSRIQLGPSVKMVAPWGNIFKKGQTTLRGKEHREKAGGEQRESRRREQQGKSNRRCSTLGQVCAQRDCGPWRTHTRRQEISEQQGVAVAND